MPKADEYVVRIDSTCGKEEDIIVTFKYDRKDEAIEKILKKAKTEKSIAGIVFELTFGNVSFRLYGSGKAIFRGLRDKKELNTLLAELLS